MRQAGQHHPPARPRQLHRLPHRLRAARGLDDEVHALAPERARRRHCRAGGDAHGGVGAERARHLEAPRSGPPRAPTAPRAQHLDGEQAQGAHSEHGRRLAGDGSAATDRPRDDRQRLGEEELIVGQVRGRGPAHPGGESGLLAQPAVHVDAHRGAREAEIAVALAAEGALAARVVRLHRHLLARRDIGHALAHRGHAADELVAHHQRVAHRTGARPDAVVGAAEAHREHAHHHFAGAGHEIGDGFHAQIARSVEERGAHGAYRSRRLRVTLTTDAIAFEQHDDPRGLVLREGPEAGAGADLAGGAGRARLALAPELPIFYGCAVPRGDGSAVVLVPGFLASDWYLFEIHAWLARIGYRPELSRVGRNADCLDVIAERLFVTIEAARAATGRPVHLIGHSLGGMLARSRRRGAPTLSPR